MKIRLKLIVFIMFSSSYLLAQNEEFERINICKQSIGFIYKDSKDTSLFLYQKLSPIAKNECLIYIQSFLIRTEFSAVDYNYSNAAHFIKNIENKLPIISDTLKVVNDSLIINLSTNSVIINLNAAYFDESDEISLLNNRLFIIEKCQTKNNEFFRFKVLDVFSSTSQAEYNYVKGFWITEYNGLLGHNFNLIELCKIE